jgi:hypothetical protein
METTASPEMRHELYVYYRADAHAHEAVRQAVQAFQAQLRALHPGVITRLLRKREPVADTSTAEAEGSGEPRANEEHTWMEIYRFGSGRALGPVFEVNLDRLAQADLSAYLRGPRHLERFVDPSPRD